MRILATLALAVATMMGCHHHAHGTTLLPGDNLQWQYRDPLIPSQIDVWTAYVGSNGNLTFLDSNGHSVILPGGGGGGGGSITFSVPASSILGVTGSPGNNIGLTTAGTSGGIPYFSSTSQLSSSAALTANLPVFGGGAGVAPFVGTRSGNTTEVGTVTGALVSGNCVQSDASHNLVDAGVVCSGGTPIAFSATTTNSTNAYTATLVPASGCSLSNAPVLHITFNAANTGPATLTACGGTAVAIDAQGTGGLSALVGGEIAAGNTERVLQYNVTAAVWVLANNLGAQVADPCTSQTITAAQFASGFICTIRSAGQTFVFPVVTSLSPQGAMFFQSIGQYFTVTPAAADGVNGGTINTSAVFGPGAYAVTTGGSSGTSALGVGGGGRALPVAISWLPAQNLAAAALPIGNLKNTNGWMITAITCTPEVLVGGTATIDVWIAPSGTGLGSGTKISTSSCNANTGAATDQSMLSAPVSVPAGDRVGIIAAGAGFTGGSSAGSGVVTVTLQQ